MDTQSIEKVILFATDPVTRYAFVFGVSIGCVVGFFAGMFFTRGLYRCARSIINGFAAKRAERERKEQEYRENCKSLAELRRSEKERRKQECELLKKQEQQKAAKLKKQSDMRAAMNGLHFNSQKLIVDNFQTVYCSRCINFAIRVPLKQDELGYFYCPECGWQCPVDFFQIIY